MPEQALETWRAVLDCDAHAEQALGEAERLGTMLGKHADLIALYQALAESAIPRTSPARQICSRGPPTSASPMCRTNRPPLRRGAACSTWIPSNAATGAKAADALELLYIDAGDMAGLVHVLHIKADWAADEGDKGRLLLRVADLQENRLADVAAAVATYRGLLGGAQAVSGQAFDNLDRIFQKTGQTRERVGLLKQRLEHLDVAPRRTLRFQVAEILEAQLHDLDEAVAAIRPILDDFPEDREALTALSRLFELQGAAVEHLEILERLLQIAPNDVERVELTRRIAGLLQGPLVRRAEALDRWRESCGWHRPTRVPWRKWRSCSARRIPACASPRPRRSSRSIPRPVITPAWPGSCAFSSSWQTMAILGRLTGSGWQASKKCSSATRKLRSRPGRRPSRMRQPIPSSIACSIPTSALPRPSVPTRFSILSICTAPLSPTSWLTRFACACSRLSLSTPLN